MRPPRLEGSKGDEARMTSLSTPLLLIARRLRANWRLTLVVFSGIIMATTLLSSAPLYLGAVEELGLRHSLQFEKAGVLDTAVLVPYRPLDKAGYASTSDRATTRTREAIGPLVEQQVSHIKTQSLGLAAPLEGYRSLLLVSVQSYSEYEEHSRVLEGAFPKSLGAVGGPSGTRIEVAVGKNSADAFSIAVGDDISIIPQGGNPSRILTARVTGILEATDIRETYWSFAIDPFSPQIDISTGGEVALLPVLVPPDTFLEDIASSFQGLLVNYWWYFYVDVTLLEADDAAETRLAMAALSNNLAVDLPGATVFSGLERTLERFEQKLFFSKIPIQIMLILVMAIVLYYLIMVANVVVDRHLDEIALLRSRGANGMQVMSVYLWEALFLSIVAVVIGPLLGNLLVPLLGKAPAFAEATNGALLPTELTVSVFLFALLGAGLSFLALLLPAIKSARFNVLNVKASIARPSRLLFFHTYYLDFFFLALAGLLYWELTQRGNLVTQRLFGADSVNYLLLTAPVIFMLSFSLIFLRILPILLTIASHLASWTSHAWLTLGLMSLARNPVPILRPTLLLTLIAGMAMFAFSYNQTLEQSFEDRGLFNAGSDARLVGLPSRLSAPPDELARSFEAEPAVDVASAAYRFEPADFSGLSQRSFSLLAIDSIKFHNVSFYREDFSATDLFTLLRKLDQGRSIDRGLELPVDLTRLGIWVKPSQPYSSKSLWFNLRDGSGATRLYRLGRLDFNEWRFLQTDLTDASGNSGTGLGPEGRFTLQSIFVWELDFPESPVPVGTIMSGLNTTGLINLSDLTAFSPSQPDGATVDRLDSTLGWRAMETRNLLPEEFDVDRSALRGDRPTVRLSWTAIPGTGMRGIFPTTFTDPLPILASNRFLESTGRRVGDIVEVQVAGVTMPVRIADSVVFFPTMEPGQPFVLGNLDTLLYYANLFRGTNQVLPNEVWFALTDNPNVRFDFLNDLRSSQMRQYLAVDLDSTLASLRSDPLVGAGSRGIAFTIIIVLIVVSIIGYFGYFYVSSYQAPLESAVLRALGLSSKSLLGMQVLSHGTILVAALGFGAWIGSRTHGVMITFLEHTERGRQVTPPFVPQTDWTGIGIILLAALGAVAGVLLWASLSYGRAPIWQALRRGGE